MDDQQHGVTWRGAKLAQQIGTAGHGARGRGIIVHRTRPRRKPHLIMEKMGGRAAVAAQVRRKRDDKSGKITCDTVRMWIARDSVGPVALQGRCEDQMTLTAIKDAALLRMQVGDTTTLTPFRDRDNIDHNLTPPQVVALWQAGAAWASAVYQANWALKDLNPIPEDFTDDAHWPVSD